MTNCCDAWGRCTQGANCPVREAAHTRAAEQFCRPTYPLHIEMYDAPGNLVDDFAKWWGNRAWWEQIGYVCGAVGACCLVAGLLVGYAK